MKKTIFAIFWALWLQLNCFAGSSISVHVSVTIPLLPEISAQQSVNTPTSGNGNSLREERVIISEETLIRDGRRVIVKSCVER